MAATLSVTAPSDFRSLSRQPPADPDIHATLSDFLTYTEHFPSHLTRALSLIEDQRARSERKIKTVHDDTTIYSIRPTIEGDKPDAAQLRKSISYALEEAERSCRMAVEEATRLDETCLRESKRLDLVLAKLKAQPMPPSRDPTPEQQALTSPNLKRERRLSIRKEDEKADRRPSRHLTDKAATKLRGRKVMVPGEVLPPPDPNAPVESISDWTSPRVSPPLEEPPIPSHHKKESSRARSRTPKVPKVDRDRHGDREKEGRSVSVNQKPRGPRAPGQPGTNAHSAIAGISTSNALLALTPPPDDAAKGSKWLPWMKLTEWEMAKLRKRMKKNAIWVPSQTMVRRELKNLGRGVAGRDAARQLAETTSAVFVDEHDDADPTKVYVSGEETAQMNAILGPQIYADDEDADAELINRGMRLNEAKKLKRQRVLEEMALQAQIAREQGGGDEATIAAATTATAKKRKRDATPTTAPAAGSLLDTPDPLSRPGPTLKKLKLSAPGGGAGTATSTSQGSSLKIPLAPAGVSSSPKANTNLANTANRSRRRAATPQATRKPTLILKAGKAVSEEPPNRRISLRRGSNASLPGQGLASPLRGSGSKVANGVSSSTTTGGGRRSKRPAPVPVDAAAEGGAKFGVAKRKAAPRKSRATGANKASTSEPVPVQAAAAAVMDDDTEPISPDEPRYCFCGDVSWGTMIACDNEDNCEREWFHLSCVGLEELPPRRTKWYCSDCRKKLKLGPVGNAASGRKGVGR